MSGPEPDPDETAPYRSGSPWTTPSGEPVDLSKPAGPPATPPPTTPYPAYQQPYPQPYPQPGYAQPVVPYAYTTRTQGTATTAMWLGITGLAGVVLTPVYCLTLPLLVCSPIAWAMGASARSTIRQAPPGTWANEGQATAGFVMGIIGSVLGLLAIVLVVAFLGFAFSV